MKNLITLACLNTINMIYLQFCSGLLFLSHHVHVYSVSPKCPILLYVFGACRQQQAGKRRL